MKTIPNTHSSVTSYLIIISGSFLFCAKGILVKELFSHGFNAEEVLALRVATALPFYAIAGVIFFKSWSKISRCDILTSWDFSM